MPRIVTHAELARVPDEGVFYLEEDAALTPLAEERARARRIEIRRTAASVAQTADPKELEEAARRILSRLGPVDGETAKKVVAEVVATIAGSQVQSAPGLPAAADYCTAYLESERRHARRRAVLT